MSLRRVRGTVLRLVRRRLLTSAVGVVLLLPAVWLESGAGHGAWWVDGVSLILGATGAALLWTGIVGLRPDYVDRAE
jgi:hypothetical protein